MNALDIVVLFYLLTMSFTFLVFLLSDKFSLLFKRLVTYGKQRSFQRKVEKRYREMVGLDRIRKPTFSGAMLIIIFYLIFGVFAMNKYLYFAAVASYSMYPTLDKGDLILVQSFHLEPEVGDIILFSGIEVGDEERREFVSHRVKKIEGEKIYTGGDARGGLDPWVVHREQIVGKVVTLFGQPVKIPKIGEYLIMEEGKSMRNILLLQYFLNMSRIYGFLIFITAMLLYLYLTAREARRREVSI
jgi:signal peptidase